MGEKTAQKGEKVSAEEKSKNEGQVQKMN